MKPKDYTSLAVMAFVLLFYMLTIRAGHPWGDDFAMYVHEAKNLAEHIPLSDTGYIYNPYRPILGPRLYPPVFPALLVPAYWLGGLNNLTPMKGEIVLFFIATLVVLWRGLGADLSPLGRAAMLAIIGFNPLLWDFKDSIMPEIPFTFVLYLTLALVERLRANLFNPPEVGDAVRRRQLWRFFALAALVYLCYGTRTIGIVIIPTLLLLAALYWKGAGKHIAAAAGLGFVFCLLQLRFLGNDASYLDQTKLPLMKLLQQTFANVIGYSWSLSTFWENPYSKAVRNAFFVVASLLALLAYVRHLRRAPRSYEIFLPLYLGIVVLWPNGAGFRYLIPVVPLYAFYIVEGAESLVNRLPVRTRAVIFASLFAAILLSYGAQFARADFGAFKGGIAKKESLELFSFVKSNTNANDVFIFAKPRALSLYTGRASSIYPRLQSLMEVCRYAQTIGATYFITAPEVDDPRFDAFLGAERPAKRVVFANSDFRVLQLRSADLQECSSAGAMANSMMR